jgi:hypothetical protein
MGNGVEVSEAEKRSPMYVFSAVVVPSVLLAVGLALVGYGVLRL